MRCWIWLLLALPNVALAAPDVVFRCTNADGAVSVQDVPCPSGSAQIIQRRGAAASTTTTSGGIDTSTPSDAGGVLDSAPLPPAASPADERYEGGLLDSMALRRAAREAAAQDEAADDDRPPPPDIFRCLGNDGSQYLHEPGPAPARCELLSITGLGGSLAPGNAASCEVVRDTCTAVEEAQRCGSWQQRLRTARGRERFASPANEAAARNERERIQAVLEASNCPVPPSA